MSVPNAKRWIAAAAAAWLLAPLMAGCGCGKQEAKADGISQLRQTRLRFAKEERKALCYVVAEVENAGRLPVREVKVTATLKGKSGKPRGVNHTFLRNVQPGEKRLVYMTVTTHGDFYRVELSFHDPRERG